MAKKNWSISTVVTAPSPTTSGTSLVVETGHGSRFADDEPAIIFPANEQPISSNAEIVMITNIATDTLTITRTQESTSARDIQVGDVIMQGFTAKDWNDLVAGATMNADTDVKANGYVIDEDTMASNLDTKVPTQQSVKAYSDTKAPKSEWANGWISAGETWTYASADAPTFVITVPSGAASRYSVGMKIKLTQTTVKYFIITAVSDTTITVYGGTDYTLIDAAISANYYSMVKSPQGFPVSPIKWTLEYTYSAGTSTQASPTQNVWYNIGGSLVIHIGEWFLSYSVVAGVVIPSAGYPIVEATLSTANNSASDISLSCAGFGGSIVEFHSLMKREKTLLLAAKTTYYLNCRTTNAGATRIDNDNTRSPISIKAVCAYL